MTEPAPKFDDFENWRIAPVPESLRRKRQRKSPSNDNRPDPPPQEAENDQPQQKSADEYKEERTLPIKPSLKRIRQLGWNWNYREEVYEYPPESGLGLGFSTFIKLVVSGTMIAVTGPAQHPAPPTAQPRPVAIETLHWGPPSVTRYD